MDEIQQLTGLLRSSSDPFWARLRELLRERGITPERAALAESFPDDVCFEFGIVVNEDGAVFRFGYTYPGEDLVDMADGTFTEWEDITPKVDATPYRSSAQNARVFLSQERSS